MVIKYLLFLSLLLVLPIVVDAQTELPLPATVLYESVLPVYRPIQLTLTDSCWVMSHDWVDTKWCYQSNQDDSSVIFRPGYKEIVWEGENQTAKIVTHPAIDTRQFVTVQYCRRCGLLRLNIKD